jgi:hypothetical protein
VHVLGVCHHSSANARSVQEVAAAVKPDAVAFEYANSDASFRSALNNSVQSTYKPMMGLVPRLMDTPIESYQQAHRQLSATERKVWEAGLSMGGLRLGPSTSGVTIAHHLLGRLAFSDAIAGACMNSLLSGRETAC